MGTDEKFVTWGLMIFIAWELWKTKEAVSVAPGVCDIASSNPNPLFVQQLGAELTGPGFGGA